MANDAQQIIESDEEEFETVEDSPNNGDYVEFGIQNHLNRSPLPKRLRLCLAACGIICISLSLAAVACGSTTLILIGRSETGEIEREHHFFIQTGFGSIILLFSGLESCRKAYSPNFGAASALIVFSLFSTASSICSALAQGVNLNFTTDSLEIKLEILVLIYSLSCTLVNACQILIAIKATTPGRLRVSFTNYELTGQKGTQLCLIGLGQILLGLFIGCLILSLDSSQFVQASQFSNENECIGWLIALAGLSLILPSCFTISKNLLYCSLAAQGLTLVACIRLVTVPATLIYLFWRSDVHTGRISVAMLTLDLLVVTSASYSFIVLITQLFNFDQNLANQLDELMRKRWPLYSYIPMIQILLTSFYVLLSIAGFLQRFLFATDFTPLPLLLLFHVVLSYKLRNNPSPYLLLSNFGWIAICEMYSLRDVYLFDYHTAVSHPPDFYPFSANASADHGTSAKVGVHIGLGAVALMELLMGLAASAMYLRTMLDTLNFVFDRILYRKNVRILHYTGAFQLLCSILMLNLGFITFLSNSLASEMLGDHVIYVGTLAVFTSIVTIVAGRVYNAVPFAFVLQILSTFFSWQVLDYCCDLFQSFLSPNDGNFFPHSLLKVGFLTKDKLITMAALCLVLLIIQLVVGGINVLLMSDVIENGEFRSKMSNIEMSNIQTT